MKNTIELIIYDFDGVMTDNRVLLFENGDEAVLVNRSDGLAVDAFKKMGIKQVIISTEKKPLVKVRAKKLGIPVMNSVADKKKAVMQYLKKNRVDSKRAIFVGNDINDKEAMKLVGWPICPADAHSDIKKISRIILDAKGGRGAVRELLDRIKDINDE